MKWKRHYFVLYFTSYVLCKHRNGKRAIPANLKLIIGSLLIGLVDR